MDPTLLVAVLAFVAIGGVGFAFAGQGKTGPNQKRLKQVAGTARPDGRKQAVDLAALKRKQSTQEALKDLADSEKQSRKRRVSIKGQIEQAGLKLTLPVYWGLAAALGLMLALGGFMAQGLLGATPAFIVGLLGIPRWILGMFVSNRQKKFANQLADAIDVIVRGVKSGLPLGQCLRIIAAESPEPLKTEFQMLVDGQAMGVPLDVSMQRMYDRMPLAEVNFFSIVLIIQQKTGGNLSESLGNLSSVLRSRKLMKEKVKALSAEAKASAMIIGALPFIVCGIVYIVRPDYIGILFNTTPGRMILLACAVMMTMGIIIMRNMVNFKF